MRISLTHKLICPQAFSLRPLAQIIQNKHVHTTNVRQHSFAILSNFFFLRHIPPGRSCNGSTNRSFRNPSLCSQTFERFFLSPPATAGDKGASAAERLASISSAILAAI